MVRMAARSFGNLVDLLRCRLLDVGISSRRWGGTEMVRRGGAF